MKHSVVNIKCAAFLFVAAVSSFASAGVDDPIWVKVAPAAAAPEVTLVMKGGGSENMSRQYSLPDSALCAGRDLAGVEKCVLDSVVRACARNFGCLHRRRQGHRF